MKNYNGLNTETGENQISFSRIQPGQGNFRGRPEGDIQQTKAG